MLGPLSYGFPAIAPGDSMADPTGLAGPVYIIMWLGKLPSGEGIDSIRGVLGVGPGVGPL